MQATYAVTEAVHRRDIDLRPGSASLWTTALELHPWELVLDGGCPDQMIDELVEGAGVGPAPSFCARVLMLGDEREVVDGARRLVRDVDTWALVVEIARLPPAYLGSLAEAHAVFLQDCRTRRLVRLPGGNTELVGELLTSTWLHTEDCLITSDGIAAGIESRP